MRNLPKIMKKHDQQDILMQLARKWVTQHQFTNISVSRIQRHFRIGYNRAANIIDMLEREGCFNNKEPARNND